MVANAGAQRDVRSNTRPSVVIILMDDMGDGRHRQLQSERRENSKSRSVGARRNSPDRRMRQRIQLFADQKLVSSPAGTPTRV
jgi:hypothetical protein